MAVFIFSTIIIQYFFYKESGLAVSNFPFLDGVPITVSTVIESKYLLQWYFPIFFILLYFSGIIKNELTSCGLAFITRSYNKTKWLINHFLRIWLLTFSFVFIQTLLFSVGNVEDFNKNYFLLLLLYYLLLILLISIQTLLDLYVIPNLSFIIVNIFVVASVLVHNILFNSFNYLEYIFFVPSIMGLRNGLTESEITQGYYPFNFIIILIILLLACVFGCIKRIKKMDII